MIICDITEVNTGKKIGVGIDSRRCLNLKVPQFVCYQHHVLDIILGLVMDEVQRSNTKSLNIEYLFVSVLITNYEDLKEIFAIGTDDINDKSG